MKWVDDVRGADSIREVARRSGINQATLNRQINLDMLAFESVRDISRAYDRVMLADLVATGHLSAADIGVDDIANALNAASDTQLVAAVANRLGVDLSIFDKPITEAFAHANVHQFPTRNVPAPSEDLGEVAGQSDIRHEEDTDDYDA